jgi:general stress protein 26
MAREEVTEKSIDELITRAWKIAEDSYVATLITIEGGKAIARPMGAKADRDAGVIRFLTSAESRKVQQAERDGAAATVFCAHGNGYASFVGVLTVSNDRAQIRELWSAHDKAWWDSADDPEIRVVTFTPSEAELWDGPNKVAAVALMLTAAVTGAKPRMGDHARIPAR